MAYGDSVTTKKNIAEVRYRDDELAEFDKVLEPYKTPGKHTDSRILTNEGWLRYLRDQKVVRLYPNGQFSVICDNDNGKTSCHRYAILDDKYGQYLDWLGRKQFAKRRELKELDALYEHVATN